MELESKKAPVLSESGNKRVTRSSARGPDPASRVSKESKPIKKEKPVKVTEKKLEKPKEVKKRGRKANGKENGNRPETALISEVPEVATEKTPLKEAVPEKTEKENEASTVKKDEGAVGTPRKTPVMTPVKPGLTPTVKENASVRSARKGAETPLKTETAGIATPKKTSEDAVDLYFGTGSENNKP